MLGGGVTSSVFFLNNKTAVGLSRMEKSPLRLLRKPDWVTRLFKSFNQPPVMSQSTLIALMHMFALVSESLAGDSLVFRATCRHVRYAEG